jgi:hypothetical protein
VHGFCLLPTASTPFLVLVEWSTKDHGLPQYRWSFTAESVVQTKEHRGYADPIKRVVTNTALALAFPHPNAPLVDALCLYWLPSFEHIQTIGSVVVIHSGLVRSGFAGLGLVM